MGHTRGGGRRTTKWLTAGAGLPVGVSVGERGRLAGGIGSSSRERERERAQGGLARAREQTGNGPRGGSHGRKGGERPRHGLDSAQLGEGFCDTPGVSFVFCREVCPNLGRSVKISIFLSHLSSFIKLIVNTSPSSELFDLDECRIWSLLKLLILDTNTNSINHSRIINLI
jgi:hypothetical protein